MKKTIFKILAITLVGSSAFILMDSNVASAATMDPGRWESTTFEQSPGGTMQPEQEIFCVDKAIDGEKLIFADMRNEAGCTITKEERRSGTLYFEMECEEDGIARKQQGTIHSTATVLTMEIDIIVDLTSNPMMQQMMGGGDTMQTTFKMDSRRIGKCDGSEPKFDE